MSALLHSQPPSPGRPPLYLVPSPMADCRVMPASVYRRRRLAVLGVAVLCVFTIWVLAQTVVNAVSSRQATTESMQTISAVQPTADADSAYWTVRPGDTLWSIAQAVTPRGDIRPVLKRLDDRYGSSTLVAGQHILVS